MKIIHCADLHLDSKLNTNLTSEKAAERRRELLENFSRLVAYGIKEQVKVILIAGDLFDAQKISEEARSLVLREIADHPQIVFFYLTGNHERQGFVNSLPTLPKNLKLFRDHWTSYRFKGGKVTITGMNPGEGYINELYEGLTLDENSYNIVMLHGQLASGRATVDSMERIHIKELQHRNIDYLALGHVHAHAQGAIDARGNYVYPGCLEGRGYDECGSHGFELLELDEEHHVMRHQFIPFALRTIHEVAVELSGVKDFETVLTRIRNVLEVDECEAKNMARIILVGNPDPNSIPSLTQLANRLREELYDVDLVDETGRESIPMDYVEERSLKGTFVRLVQEAEELSEDDREAVLRIGLKTLLGEEVRP